jgi:transcriptional regulator with XRE-family HTH domain
LRVDEKYEKFLINLGTRIKEKRQAKNLTQIELASFIDCEVKSIQRIEKGKMNMSLKMFLLLSEVLETAPETLLKIEESDII